MIEKVRVKNFKAVRDSGNIKLSSLNAFIGNNGTGKSTIIEALSLVKSIFLNGLSFSFEKYSGLERVRHYQAKLNKPKSVKLEKVTDDAFEYLYEPIAIELSGSIGKTKYRYSISLNTNVNDDLYFVQEESLYYGKEEVYSVLIQKKNGEGILKSNQFKDQVITYTCDESPLTYNVLSGREEKDFKRYVINWLFLFIDPDSAGVPQVADRSTLRPKMDVKGRKVGEVISYLYNKDKSKFNAIIQKMNFVLPYSSDIKPKYANDIERKVFLVLEEQNSSEQIPSWLFSSGTLRILCLITALNSFENPPVIFIEEIENGLDPRTINMILSELQSNLNNTQFVITTHSPYFLDLLELRHVILVEKDLEKGTTFTRPDDNKSLDNWKEKYSPGKLYTMNLLQQKGETE